MLSSVVYLSEIDKVATVYRSLFAFNDGIVGSCINAEDCDRISIDDCQFLNNAGVCFVF